MYPHKHRKDLRDFLSAYTQKILALVSRRRVHKAPTHTHARTHQVHTHTSVPVLGDNMIYLLAGRPIKNQSGCSEYAGNGKATAVEEVGLINGHFHLVA